MLSKKGLFGLVISLFLVLGALVLAKGPPEGTPVNPLPPPTDGPGCQLSERRQHREWRPWGYLPDQSV